MSPHPIFTEIEIQDFRNNFDTLVKGPANKFGSLAVLFISIAMFYISGVLSTNPLDILILIGVLFFHELGHLLFMKIFGYGDLRVFFIPFLGAAAMGKHDSASQVKKAIVSIMGPVPGIILAILLFEMIPEKNTHVAQAINTLLFINMFNLLPLTPLDGGRLVQDLFTGSIVWSTVFSIISAALLALVAIQAETYGLLVIVALVLMGQYSTVQYDKASKISELPKESLRSLKSVLALSNEHLNLLLSSFKISFRRAFEPKVRYNLVYKHLENMADYNNHTPSRMAPRLFLFFVYFIILIAAIVYSVRVTPRVEAAAPQPKEKVNSPIDGQKPAELKQAILYLDKAITETPKDASLYMRRGRMKSLLKDYRGVIADAEKAMALDRQNLAAYLLRGNARINTGELRGAIEDYNWIIMSAPDNATMLSNRCFARFLLSDLKPAAEDCEKSIRLQPDFLPARINLAHVKVALKDYSGALYDVDSSLQYRPNDGEAYYIRAKAKAGLKAAKDVYCVDFAQARKLGYSEILPPLAECK